MNKLNTLITIGGFITATVTAQTSIINMQKRLAEKNKISEPQNINKQYTPLVLKEAALTTTLIFNAFSGSSNVYGLLSNAAKPLQYNDNLNAVSFIQRKSATYVGQPADNSGVIVAMISTNWGSNWDSTCIYSSANDPGRYPQGGIYNPPGNTNIANAYAVGSGPSINSGSWSGSWYASKQLATPGSTLYNNTASSVPNAMQLFSNSQSTYAANQGKQDFAQFGFTSTDNGVVRTLAQIINDVNASQTDIRGAQLVKGTFNAGVFVWTTDSFIPPVVVQPTSLEKQMSTNLYQAWDEAGTVGYIVFIGTRTGQTGSNIGWQPIVYKTSNGGTSWALLNGINFNSPSYQCIVSHLDPVWSSSSLRIPFFNVNEGLDCTVDANGRLHVVTTIASTASNDLDSLASVTGHGSEDYTWNHTPGKRPYLYDFITDGNSAWSYITVDSLSTEAPGSQSGSPGFSDNPWDDNAGKITSDSRIQVSRTPNGQHLVYTWAESDTNATTNTKKWNTIPNIKARLYNVSTGSISATKINVTNPSSGTGVANVNVVNRAMLHYTSQKSSTANITSGTTDIIVPITVCNSQPYSQLTNNTHYFSAAKLTFTNTYVNSSCSIVGIEELVKQNLNFEIMPNPASGILNIQLEASVPGTIEILNTVGQVVYQSAIYNQQTVVNIGTFTSGIYFVKLKQGNTTRTKKLIVE